MLCFPPGALATAASLMLLFCVSWVFRVARFLYSEFLEITAINAYVARELTSSIRRVIVRCKVTPTLMSKLLTGLLVACAPWRSWLVWNAPHCEVCVSPEGTRGVTGFPLH